MANDVCSPDVGQNASVSIRGAPASLELLTMRIATLSDQHGFLPEVPACDLLIIAGDICPDRFGPFLASQRPEQQKSWFDRNVRAWLANAPATHKILTWGNHDWCGQECTFHTESSEHRANTELQILVDRGTTVESPDGPLSVWATPWSNQFMTWAFMRRPAELETIYAKVPDGIDILVSHQPPFGYGDRLINNVTGKAEHLGSHELLKAIRRVRPRLVICGHIHDGYGRFECEGVPIFNVSVVDEQYRLVRPATVIEL
jgi:Icc-related predicted phosphoesterase